MLTPIHTIVAKKKPSTAVRLDSMPIKPIMTVKFLLFQLSLWYRTTLVGLNLARLTAVVVEIVSIMNKST